MRLFINSQMLTLSLRHQVKSVQCAGLEVIESLQDDANLELVCWAACQQECQWKEFSLESQDGQQLLLYFLPAPSSRAWTTDHSHAQILVPGNS